MAYENKAGIKVHNHYGPRDTGGSVGVERSTDSVHQLSLYMTAQSLKDGFVPPVSIPKGVLFLRAVMHVDEAFTGVTQIDVGEVGKEDTNGIPLVVADLSAGTRVPTGPSVGTWKTDSSTGTTAAAFVGIDVTGTPTAGRGTLVLEFINKARD